MSKIINVNINEQINNIKNTLTNNYLDIVTLVRMKKEFFIIKSISWALIEYPKTFSNKVPLCQIK
mgnify:CR=1 FL=1